MILYTLLFAGTGLLLVALAVPLVRRRVKPNVLYGLRVPATFSDEWVWYEANAKSGRDLLIVGILQFVMALALAREARINEATYSIVNAAILLVAVVIAAIIGWRRANALLRQRQQEASAR